MNILLSFAFKQPKKRITRVILNTFPWGHFSINEQLILFFEMYEQRDYTLQVTALESL